jgi:hypothetical protein
MRRHAPLTDNLRAWLQPIAKSVGKIISGGLRKLHEAAREKAGIQWQANILRTRSCPTVWRTRRIRRKSHSNPVMSRTCCSNIICTSSQKKMQSGISTSGPLLTLLAKLSRFPLPREKKNIFFSKVHFGSIMDPRQSTPSLTGAR